MKECGNTYKLEIEDLVNLKIQQSTKDWDKTQSEDGLL